MSNTKAISVVDEVRGSLQKLSSQFKAALPPQIPVERFIRVAQTAITTSPQLMEANRASLWAACVKAAQDGLLPDGKEAVLVTYKTKAGIIANYQPMVGGILKKVRNSGELASISPHIVYSNDEFEFWIDEAGEHLKHKPKLGGERGEPTHVYAIAKTKDGAVYIEVMTTEEIEKVRSSSRAKDSGPWVNWWGEMARKTVIRRLAKRLPMSTDLDDVIRRDDELYDLDKSEASNGKSQRPSRVAKIVEEAKPVAEVAAQEPEQDEDDGLPNFDEIE